jgi:tetratricopeptide (TPR) repeat protein
MRKRSSLFSVSAFICLIISTAVPLSAFGQGSALLQRGIEQYQKENYEEAIEIFTKVREQEPASPQAAFFLGMAYKQVLDFSKAAGQLRDAVTLIPPIKEALVELIDTLYQIDKLDEAKKWLATAEGANVAPSRVAFLKGLILAKENNYPEAIKAFENAKQIDQALSQASDFQVGLIHIKESKLDKAKARFDAIITHDPLSDLASFARQYQAIVEERIYLERPLRLTVGVFGGYDTNMVLKPLETSVAENITDEKGTYLSSSVRLDYIPKLDGPWLFNAQYSLASNVNSKHTHTHDLLANNVSIAPGYNFGRFALNLNASYTNVLIRTDPDLNPDPESNPGYKRSLDYISVGPTVRYFLNQSNILELFIGYDKKTYHNQKPASPDADRDSVAPRTYLSWIWLFKEDAFLNLRYDFTNERANGRQWDNNGHRLTFNLSFSVMSEELARRFGPVTMQITGSGFFQEYSNETDFGVIKTTRRDTVYTGSMGLTWKFWKYASFIAQYTRTQSNSNVVIFEYNRDQYTAGFEFRY